MSKYYLTASHYNLYTKEYENEIIVKLPNVDLSNIQTIDNFTSSHTYIELMNLIEKETNTKNINTLSIKYYKNKEEYPIYYRTIIDNKDFATCTTNTVTKDYKEGRYKKATAISYNNKYLLNESKKLIDLIKNKDLTTLEEIFGTNHILCYLINRYLTSSYDDYNSEKEDYDLILQEFSRYQTFRRWIIAKEKTKIKEKKVTQVYNKKNNYPKLNVKKSKRIPTIEELEDLYEQNFNSNIKQENPNSKITYQDIKTYEHNTKYLNEDKEEFISTEEMDQMYNYEHQENKSPRIHH